MVKNLPAMQETWVWSLGWEDPWRREWLHTPVCLPGEFHGQRSLTGYSPWGRRESDVTEHAYENCYYLKKWTIIFKNVCFLFAISCCPDTVTSVLICCTGYTSVAQSYLTLCNPVDHSTPGFPVHYQLNGIWVWISSRYWWWIGKPDVLQSMGLQTARHDWTTAQDWNIGGWFLIFSSIFIIYSSEEFSNQIMSATKLMNKISWELCELTSN